MVRVRANAQLIAASVLLAFGLFAVWQASLLKVGSATSPGPGFFPLVLGIALALLAAALVGQAWRAGAAPASVEPTSDYKTIAGVLVLILIASLLLEPVGYVPTMIVLTAALLKLAGRGWKATLVIAVVAAVASYLLFDRGLGVPLPQGLLDGLL
jgi:putative tricarboxylic transport membrane protein